MTLHSFEELKKSPEMVAEDLGRRLAEEQIARMGHLSRNWIQSRVFAMAPHMIALVTATLGYKCAVALALR